MTVQQIGVATLDDIVVAVQHKQNYGGAEGLYGNTGVNVATCRWQKPPKGSSMRILILAFTGRRSSKHNWCVNEVHIGHEVRDGIAYLNAKGMPDLMLRL